MRGSGNCSYHWIVDNFKKRIEMINVPIGINVELLEQAIRTRVMQTLSVCLEIVRFECEKASPIDTGELRESIRIEQPKWITPFILEGQVFAGDMEIVQAYYTEKGTRSHGPVFARSMHFHWKGVEIFAKRVMGVTAMNWMQSVADFSRPRVIALFKALEAEFHGWLFTSIVMGPSGGLR